MMSESYLDYQLRLKQEQKDLSKDDVMELLSGKVESAIDLDNLPKQQHNWVERGAVVSCEGAGHPWHKHFLR